MLAGDLERRIERFGRRKIRQAFDRFRLHHPSCTSSGVSSLSTTARAATGFSQTISRKVCIALELLSSPRRLKINRARSPLPPRAFWKRSYRG